MAIAKCLILVLQVLASRSDHKDQWGSILLHPYSIAVDDIYVYWDDWQSGKVFKIHKSFTGKVETLVNRNTDLPAKSRYEIKVYYSGSQVGERAIFNSKSLCPVNEVSKCSKIEVPLTI
jgi:hypothetical protein